MSVATADILYCDCHGTQVMAKIRDEKLVIRVRTHGEYHTVALMLDRFPQLKVDSHLVSGERITAEGSRDEGRIAQ